MRSGSLLNVEKTGTLSSSSPGTLSTTIATFFYKKIFGSFNAFRKKLSVHNVEPTHCLLLVLGV